MSNFKILKEGYKVIAIAFAIAFFIKFFICDFLGNIAILVALFIVYVYRDDSREVFITQESVLSPIDGKIKAIDYVDGIQKIYCDVNLCDTHVLRAPVDGEYSVESLYHGTKISADMLKAKHLNERATIEFPNLTLNLLSGVCNSKLQIEEKNDVKQGERIGLFFNGLVIIETEKALKLSIKIGDKIKAGQTIIGKYNG